MDLTPPPLATTRTPSPVAQHDLGESAAAPPAIHATIEALVLRGFPALDARLVQSAFTAELERRLRQNGGAPTQWMGRDADALPAVRIQLGRALRPDTLGREIARAVVRSLTRQQDGTP